MHPTHLDELLLIDSAAETARLSQWLRQAVLSQLRRRGAVVGISGGVDSAVVLSLCVKAFGPDKVIGLILPDRESSPESEQLARQLSAELRIEPELEDVTPALEGLGCYRRRDEAIRRAFPEYDPDAGYRAKLVLPGSVLGSAPVNVFVLTIVRPDGSEASCTVEPAEYLQIVAATNLKQRTRMARLYYHAELHHFAVIGTANRNERELGFFVKYGDGGVDAEPIAHLYKTQVYQLAEYLDVPIQIRRRTPTTDTYSAPCSQQDFFFRMPFATLDRLWSAQANNLDPGAVAQDLGLATVQVERAFKDLSQKQRATEPLRQPPLRPPPQTVGVNRRHAGAELEDCVVSL